MSKHRRSRTHSPTDKTASHRRPLSSQDSASKSAPPPADDAVVGLRIIGGTLRGRKIEYSGDMRTRPMKDRVREAVFNLLGHGVVGTHAIDLFAGTGAMAFESLSRGAAKATCIERHYPTSRLIEKGAAQLGIADRLTVVFGDAFHWTKQLASPPNSPVTVFCSPPYDFFVERKPAMLELIARWLQVAPAASQIVVEADERFSFAELPQAETWDVRAYPPAFVGIWEKSAEG